MTLLNPKPNRNYYGRKNYLYCKRCNKPFTADGRGKRLYCGTCKVTMNHSYRAIFYTARKTESAFRLFWVRVQNE